MTLIGVLTEEDPGVVSEFFELFKTPWEYCRTGVRYHAVLSTVDPPELPDTDLLIVSTPQKTTWDRSEAIITTPCGLDCHLDVLGKRFPIFGSAISFEGAFRALHTTGRENRCLIFECNDDNCGILRIGYNIFSQIRHLLTIGQRSEYAVLPTTEVHIDILRQGLRRRKVPFVEIPPVPSGCFFFACLTHDVDFYRIRDHLFDATFLGFVYRASLGEWPKLLAGHGSFKRMVLNWWALLRLPFVYMGLLPDTWTGFAQYAELERGFGATYYLIPFKGQPGRLPEGGQAPSRRATRYDAGDMQATIRDLESQGYEIGLHGIDAWHSPEDGAREAMRISHFTREPVEGVRMHWLYLDEKSHRRLEEAGFAYDTSVGYNDAAGFKCGTAQAFRPIGAHRILELPMVVQDSSLFYSDRMHLTEKEALELAAQLVQTLKRFGGSMTVNWHHRSLAPERLWGDCYRRLLRMLAQNGACFLDAGKVVEWFRMRRHTTFKTVQFDPDGLQIALECPGKPPVGFTLRIYHPAREGTPGAATSFRDIPFSQMMQTKVPFAESAASSVAS